jgi:hypothetical protein
VLEELLDDGKIDEVGLQDVEEVIEDRYHADHVDGLKRNTTQHALDQ